MLDKIVLSPTITDLSGERIVKYENKIYKIRQFKGKKSLEIMAKITKYASGTLGRFAQSLFSTGEDEDVSAAEVVMAGSMLGAFADVDDPELIKFICEDIVAEVVVDNESFDWDKEFTGTNMLVCFDLVRQVVVYNYSPVFQQLGIAAIFNKKAVEE